MPNVEEEILGCFEALDILNWHSSNELLCLKKQLDAHAEIDEPSGVFSLLRQLWTSIKIQEMCSEMAKQFAAIAYRKEMKIPLTSEDKTYLENAVSDFTKSCTELRNSKNVSFVYFVKPLISEFGFEPFKREILAQA